MIHRSRLVPACITLAIVMVACASSAADGGTQPSSSDQVATVVAATLQALTPELVDTPSSVPEAPGSLLPHSLYFLGKDGQAITQVYRIERDGRTVTQLTSETVNVADFDVSLLDGSIVFAANNQLLLTNADGSNRRALVDGGAARNENNPAFFKDPLTNPVFSPDGQTIAYARYAGVHLYDLSTGVSSLVIESQYTDVMLINGVEQALPIEIYTPGRYSPDGAKLLIRLHYTDSSSAAIYHPAQNELIRLTGEAAALECCDFTSVFEWSADSSSIYVANPRPGVDGGGMWRVDDITGAVTTLVPYVGDNGMINHFDEPYLASDGQLYFFFASYSGDLGPLHRPPGELTLVRSAADGVMDHTVLSKENLRLMNEALWAPDASLVVVAFAPSEEVYDGGQAAIVYLDGRPNVVLTPFARQMKWGP